MTPEDACAQIRTAATLAWLESAAMLAAMGATDAQIEAARIRHRIETLRTEAEMIEAIVAHGLRDGATLQ